MRIRTLLVALLAVVVVVAGAVGILLSRADGWRPRIQAELQAKLNRPVSIEHLSLKLLPLQIKLEGFKIGEAANFPQERPFATANTVFVSAGLLSILTGNPEVKNLTLDKPQVELIRNVAGVWNYSSLGKNDGGKSGGSNSQLSLNLLNLSDGQLGFTDQLNHQPRNVYDHIDLKLTDFAPGKQFGLNVGVHFPGDGRQMLEFTGKAGPLTTATENALPPVNGHLSIEQVSLAAVNQFSSGALPPDTNSVVSGEADINSLADVLGCKGNLRFENTILNGAKLDYPISGTYNIEEDVKQKKLLIRSGLVQLASTSFMASGDVSLDTTPATLNVNVRTDNSSITELAKLAGGLGFGFSPAYKVDGKVNADVTAKGAATAPQLTGSVRARNLSASGGEIKQPVAIPELDLTLSPDSIISNTFSATSGSTTLGISFTLLQYAAVNRSVDAAVKTDGANVGELLNIAKTYGVDAAQSMSGDGKLTLDLHVKGPLANASAMSYAGTASFANVTLVTPELKKPLTVASANAVFSQNSVSLENLVAGAAGTTVRGSLSAKNFAAPELAFNLNADKIDVDELSNLATPATKSKPKHGKTETPSLFLSTTGTGSLTAGLIKANDIVLKDVSTKCQLNKGVVTLSPLSAGLFSGKVNGTLTADLRPATPQGAVKMKFAGVDANALLSAVSPMKERLSGSLSADTDLRFAVVPSDELARTLNGAVSFNLVNGVIKNIDLLGEVSKIGNLLGKHDSSANGGTALKKFAGTLNFLNGVASTQNLTGELNEGTLVAKGTLNLVSQDVNMHLTASLGNNQPAGGGLLNTVLATAKGQLMVPVLITGNMAHPTVTPDTAEMAKLKLGNLGGGGAKGAVGGILGGLLGGQSADGKTKKQPANPVDSILNQFKKKQ